MDRRRPPSPGPALRVGLALLCAVLGTAPGGPHALQKRRGGDKEAVPRLEPFVGTLDEALVAARDRNAPLAIWAFLDEEQTSVRVRDEIYRGKAFAAVAPSLVVVVVNEGEHPARTIEIPGENEDDPPRQIQVCSLYETPRCEDHRRSLSRVFQEYHEDGDFKMPHLLVLKPDGTIHGRASDEIQGNQALALIAAARELAGPSLTPAELATVRAALVDLASFLKASLWHRAWHAGAQVLALTQAEVHAAPARAGVERALAGMRQELADARAWMEQGRVEDGYLKLERCVADFAETPVAEEAEDAVKAARKDPRFRDAIEKVQVAREAEEIWVKVEEALAQEKEKVAERLAQRLIERYADTPAAERARKRFPHLVP